MIENEKITYKNRFPFYSVREFVEFTLKAMGVSVQWEGTGVDECGYVAEIAGDSSSNKAPALKVGQKIVAVDLRYFRPAEVETLLGDPTNRC